MSEIVEEVVEEISSARFSGRDINLIFGGAAIGAGLGITLGFLFSRKRFETKYNRLVEQEVAEMRQYYHDKITAFNATTQKPALEKIVQEQGYSVEPPMGIAPPTAVVDAAAEVIQDEATSAKTKRAEKEAREAEKDIKRDEAAAAKERNVFRSAEVEDTWNDHQERTRRSPIRPYVIHRDEREEREAYDETTLTYYEEDDVLCNERDEVIGVGAERNMLIGEENLNKFGHGSGDPSVVYIRNDKLEIQFEVVRSPNSYAEEVHGFTHSVHRRRKVRPSFDDE